MEFKFVVWSTGSIWLKFKNHLVPHFYRLLYLGEQNTGFVEASFKYD